MIPLCLLATAILVVFFFGAACRYVQAHDDLRCPEQAVLRAARRQVRRSLLVLIASVLALAVWLCGSVVALWRGWV